MKSLRRAYWRHHGPLIRRDWLALAVMVGSPAAAGALLVVAYGVIRRAIH